jgi:hypothetical protein
MFPPTSLRQCGDTFVSVKECFDDKTGKVERLKAICAEVKRIEKKEKIALDPYR